MGRHAEPQDLAPTAPNQQTIKKSKGNRWNDKEIHRGNALGMIAQERLPPLRWRSPESCHIFGARGLTSRFNRRRGVIAQRVKVYTLALQQFGI
jgi:hypothetical protein